MKTILQSESSECGLACLAMVAGFHGYHISLPELRRRYSANANGMTLEALTRYATTLELVARPLTLDLDELSKLHLPCVLHWNLNHFVVLKKIKCQLNGKYTLLIVDPAIGERSISEDDASANFTGVAVEFTPNARFSLRPASRKIPIADLIGKVAGLRLAITQAIGIALVLELFAILSPLFNQFVIDEVIVSGDTELLKVLVIGFGILLFTQTIISHARNWFMMRWTIDLSMQWSGRVFSHLLSLPASYFERRNLGDITSRFGSIQAIQATLTAIAVDSVLDCILAVFALSMMFLYSSQLTFSVLIGILLYTLLRWISYAPLRDAARDRLVLAAKENNHFIESLRAIVPLKLFCYENERNVQWQNARLDVINRDVETEKINIAFKSASTFISGGQSLAVFYLGATQVIENSLSIGMLMAFSSYSNTFSGRVFKLIDLFVNGKMLSLHGDRLADILLTSPEPEPELSNGLDSIPDAPGIALRNVRFRYSEFEPWTIDRINLEIAPGESVALVGPSGSGKTTLCKIMLGLHPTTHGEILINGVPISRMGLTRLRKMVGTVMQDDVLLSGSILENITFFDSHVDMDWVRDCARVAAIDDEIQKLPMGYQTLVGDMGSTLSGGQRQRILLARALYKRPKILFLDEATSSLDVHNEFRVNKALRELNITRITIAHRPETISSADRVFALDAGKLKNIPAGQISQEPFHFSPEYK